MKFTDVDLLPSLQATLNEKKLTTLTEIQEKAIPMLLSGKSLVGVAETGSGKTLAYALPMLQMIRALENSGDKVEENARPRGVVIVPTRELGEQISKVMKPFTHTTRVRVRTALGGTAMEVARRNVAGPHEILVATPGRMTQLLARKLLKLDDVRLLVFDEADQMLDQGFLPDAQHIFRETNKSKGAGELGGLQVALFSATITAPVEELINEMFEHAEIIRSAGHHKVVPSLTTVNKKVIDGKRMPVLEQLLNEKYKGGTLIFTNTREQCDKLADELHRKGYKVTIYRGEMDKVERRQNLKAFREGKADVMISTDLGSRGLDLEHVSRVINYHLPKDMTNYIHRVGRTARAGRKGMVVNLVTERDEKLVGKLGQGRLA
jgi:ATP-dependent RNA helicase RhlE